MRRVIANFVLKLLTDDQKASGVRISTEWKEIQEADSDFIHSIKTGDGS